MPIFQGGHKDIEIRGPEIAVSVGLNSKATTILESKGLGIPAPVHLNALIDTGAGFCAIRQGIPAKLGLKPVGTRNTISVTDAKPIYQPVYYMLLTLEDRASFNATVTELPLALPYKQEFLIGRDILKYCILEYLGPTNSWTLKTQAPLR